MTEQPPTCDHPFISPISTREWWCGACESTIDLITFESASRPADPEEAS